MANNKQNGKTNVPLVQSPASDVYTDQTGSSRSRTNAQGSPSSIGAGSSGNAASVGSAGNAGYAVNADRVGNAANAGHAGSAVNAGNAGRAGNAGDVGTRVGAGVVGANGSAGVRGAAAAKPKSHLGRNIAIVVVSVAVVTALVIWAVTALLDNSGDFYDSNSIIGQAPYKSQEEIQAELDRIVEEGMLNISIASVIDFDNGTSEGTAYIENVPNNHYVMQVDIKLDDTGEEVYKSGGLKPGNYIENITLSKDLDPGVYSATATFHALDEDTLEEIGQAAAKITLNVLG